MKTREGAQHPDRDAQFEHINETVSAALAAGEPVISVDAKKRELVGDFKNGRPGVRAQRPPGRGSRPRLQGQAAGARDPLRRLRPGRRRGLGQRRDHQRHRAVRGQHRSAAGGSTSAKRRYPKATTLTITADCGGSNNPRTRLWKTELQSLADKTGLQIRVCHFPPGTSKWNKIEHRMFSFVSLNWRGKPLESLEVDHQPDRRDHDQHRPEGLRPPRRAHLRTRHRDHRRATRRGQHHPTRVPRRLELHRHPFTTLSREPLARRRALVRSTRLPAWPITRRTRAERYSLPAARSKLSRKMSCPGWRVTRR